MAFRNGGFASVWEIVPAESGKYSEVRITTSRKRQDGTYEQDFTGKVRFIGDANEAIQKYPHAPGDDRKPVVKIRLDDVATTVVQWTPQGQSKAQWFTSFQCYGFTPADQIERGQTTQNTPTQRTNPATDDSFEDIPEGIDEELPFN